MNEYIENLQEIFADFGSVQAKRMFGGYGLFHEGLMFGLVAGDVLYLKADDHSADLFHERSLAQFEYDKKDKVMKMSYYMAPEEIFDDTEAARYWAVQAYEAALRSRKPPRKRT
jgi:DNA transformation protein